MESASLPHRQRLIVEEFSGALSRIYADALISVILYGSAASGEFTEKNSNINVLIVLRSTDLTELAKSYGLLNSRRFKAFSCVFFTEDFISASADTFPIEFLDIKDNYSVIIGKDTIKDLTIDTGNLRFQCEHELRSKLISIRRGYLATRDRAALERLLFRTFTSSLHIMRSIMRVRGKEPTYAMDHLLVDLEKDLSVDAKVLREILWAKQKEMKLSHKEIDMLLLGFARELEAIIGRIDKL